MTIALALTFQILLFGAATQPGSDEDGQLDERLQAFARQVRCLVCQNETLADSRAELAIDLKREIREQMKAGRSDEQIIAFLTERYGDFVLYRPRLQPRTYPLWFGPFVLLGGGLFGLYRRLRRWPAQADEPSFSVAELRRARQLLDRSEKRETA